MFGIAVVNEPSVFEPLKFYCRHVPEKIHIKNDLFNNRYLHPISSFLVYSCFVLCTGL